MESNGNPLLIHNSRPMAVVLVWAANFSLVGTIRWDLTRFPPLNYLLCDYLLKVNVNANIYFMKCFSWKTIVRRKMTIVRISTLEACEYIQVAFRRQLLIIKCHI
jgi:hypothetical protein